MGPGADQTPDQSLEAKGGPDISSTGQVSNYEGKPREMTRVFIPLGYDAPLLLPKPLLSEVKCQEINQVS